MNDRNEDRTEDRIMQAAGRLATDVAPERDLWPGIERAIARPARPARPAGWAGWAGRAWQPMLAQAAAVVLLVGASSAITWFAVKEEPRIVEVPRPGLTSEFVSYTAPQALGPEYMDARDALVTQLDRELAQLSPETRAEVERNISVIRGAIAEISAALDRDPDNRLLQQLLVDTYREEAAIVRKVGNLTYGLMPRQDI